MKPPFISKFGTLPHPFPIAKMVRHWLILFSSYFPSGCPSIKTLSLLGFAPVCDGQWGWATFFSHTQHPCEST